MKRIPKKTRSGKSQGEEGYSFAGMATEYAERVVRGEILCAQPVRQACQRHLNDLAASVAGSSRWEWRPDLIERVCKFVSALPHIKDDFAGHAARGERIVLKPWQAFILASIFGWTDRDSGVRRFREVYIEVPRKNAKSTLAAAICLYMFCADGEFGAEVYSGATTKQQAWEVFRPARLMVVRTPMLRKTFGIEVNAESLVIPRTGSSFRPLIGKPGDGASPTCAVVDEYHEHKSDDLVATMRTGMAARRQPLLVKITTAGTDRSSPCYDTHNEVLSLLAGTTTNERLFGMIYTVDETVKWSDPKALEMANPNFGISVNPETLLDDQVQAVQNARRQNDFKTKHLDLWENQDVAWLNMLDWDALAKPDDVLENYAGRDCYVGLDLASRVDLASMVMVFPGLREDGERSYSVFSRMYLNAAAVERARDQHYAGWAHAGHLTVTPGNVTDYTRIADDLVGIAARHALREVAFDPYHAESLMQFVQARPDWPTNVEWVKVPQTVQMMSPAMKELEGLVADRKLQHSGNPVLTWNMANVVCHRDRKENIYPVKLRIENKIDGAVALIMALSRAVSMVLMDPDRSNVY